MLLIMTKDVRKYSKNNSSQSAGAVAYTDCISAGG